MGVACAISWSDGAVGLRFDGMERCFPIFSNDKIGSNRPKNVYNDAFLCCSRSSIQVLRMRTAQAGMYVEDESAKRCKAICKFEVIDTVAASLPSSSSYAHCHNGERFTVYPDFTRLVHFFEIST